MRVASSGERTCPPVGAVGTAKTSDASAACVSGGTAAATSGTDAGSAAIWVSCPTKPNQPAMPSSDNAAKAANASKNNSKIAVRISPRKRGLPPTTGFDLGCLRAPNTDFLVGSAGASTSAVFACARVMRRLANIPPTAPPTADAAALRVSASAGASSFASGSTVSDAAATAASGGSAVAASPVMDGATSARGACAESFGAGVISTSRLGAPTAGTLVSPASVGTARVGGF